MRRELRKYRGGSIAPESSGSDGKGGRDGSGAPVQPSGLLEFASLLLRMAQRISLREDGGSGGGGGRGGGGARPRPPIIWGTAIVTTGGFLGINAF